MSTSAARSMPVAARPVVATATAEAAASVDRAASRIMVGATTLVSGLGAVLASVQAVMVLGVLSPLMRGVAADPFVEILLRWSFNFSSVAIVVGGVLLLRPERRSTRARLVIVAALALAAGLARSALQVGSGFVDLQTSGGSRVAALELSMTVLLAVLALGSGLTFADVWRRAREADRTRIEAQEHALSLMDDVRAEELRVRREIAASIHGSVQGAFVVLEAELRDIAAHGNAAGTRIREVADRLSALRESELRALSERLYPVELDRGLAPAVRALAARAPAHVEVIDHASAPLAGFDARVDQRMRVLIVRVLEEGQTNALRHGGAHRIRFFARVTNGVLLLEVESDGAPLGDDATLSGLRRLRQQLDVLGGSLELRAGAAAGAVLAVRVPLV